MLSCSRGLQEKSVAYFFSPSVQFQNQMQQALLAFAPPFHWREGRLVMKVN